MSAQRTDVRSSTLEKPDTSKSVLHLPYGKEELCQMPANPKRTGWVSPQARAGTYSCSRPNRLDSAATRLDYLDPDLQLPGFEDCPACRRHAIEQLRRTQDAPDFLDAQASTETG